ncbi:MAG: hypothetical protein JWN52_1842 [Actinomycetia bacterium]|nr:hypothetical protein [Actinomycetes bacterium]
MTALAAKVPVYKLDLKVPAAGKETSRRLSNGSFVRSGSRGARGALTIDNGGSDDAVITLALGKRPDHLFRNPDPLEQVEDLPAARGRRKRAHESGQPRGLPRLIRSVPC